MVARATSLAAGVTSSITGPLGAPVVVRTFGMALEFDAPNWSPPTDGGLRPYHGGWEWLWCHDEFPEHVVHQYAHRIVIGQTSEVPDVERAEELVRLALGRQAHHARVGLLPLALRVPLIADVASLPALPSRDFRCRRVVPSERHAPQLVRIGGTDAEIRIAASRINGDLRFFGEVFPCGPHETRELLDERRARRSVFPADAERVLAMPDHAQAVIVPSVQQLVVFCETASGFEIDPAGKLPGWPLGRVDVSSGRLGLQVKLPPDFFIAPFWMELV
jgi:hypothetical protein